MSQDWIEMQNLKTISHYLFEHLQLDNLLVFVYRAIMCKYIKN